MLTKSLCAAVALVFLQLKDAAKVAEYQPGQQLEIAEIIKEGDSIDIAGTTVGKGFQGKQKGWNVGCQAPGLRGQDLQAAAGAQRRKQQQLWHAGS